MNRRFFSSLFVVFFATGTIRALPPELEKLESWAAPIRVKASEVKWRGIPWTTDLPAAIRLAENGKRPLLVWASGDAPLERC